MLVPLAFAQNVPQRRVALTFDDLPKAALGESFPDVIRARRSIGAIIETLKAHHAPAIAFVNEQKLFVSDQIDARVALLDLWLEGGVPLGNHTYSHADLHKTPAPQFEDDVIRGEVVTRRLMKAHGWDEHYFRYPYLRTGPTKEAKEQVEAFLKSRGYVNAPVTIDNADYIFNKVYNDALAKDDHDLADRVRAAYLQFEDVNLDYFERLTSDTLGRNMAHIMLLHSNDINAACLDELLTRLEARGYQFITIDEALKDPAYQIKDDFVSGWGISWLHRWRQTLGKPPAYRDSPDPPKWVLDLYNGPR